MDLQTYAEIAFGFFLLCLACYGWGQPRMALTIEHWGQAIPGLEEKPDLFLARTFQRLKEQLTAAALPDCRIGFGPGRLFGNRTVFGSRPRYLIVKYSHLSIFVYAYQLPTGLFVSYWAFSKYTLWEEFPLLRFLLLWRLFQMTPYQFDVTDMCLTTIHGALFEVIDFYCEEQGLRPLEEFERRPVLRSFYARYKQGTSLQSGYGTPQQVGLLPIHSAIPSAAVGPAPVTASAPATVSPIDLHATAPSGAR